jgi:hypothetical protein
MKKPLLSLTLLLLAGAACVLNGQRWLSAEEHETIRKTLAFSAGSGMKILEVDNVQGSIRVTGYDGRDVEMVANKTIRAQSQNMLEAAKREVNLDIADKADTISIFVDQPGHERSTRNSSASHWGNRGYEVSFDFEIRVPRQTEIHLWTVNNGDIHVENVLGDFDVNNVNGGIEMSGLVGSGRAHTINGRVKAAFASNPKDGSHFGSLNGNIEVTFQRNLSADLRYKTNRGGVYTDFPVSALAAPAGTPERRNGKLVFKKEFSAARIGNGGPVLEFDGFNGDVRILEAK